MRANARVVPTPARWRRAAVLLPLLVASLAACGGGGAAPGLSIVTTVLPQATVNKAYSTALQASGGSGYQWAVVAGALPTGITLDANTGTISGTATATGTATFTVQVTSGTETAQRQFQLEVVPPGVALAMLPVADQVRINGRTNTNDRYLVRFLVASTGSGTLAKPTVGPLPVAFSGSTKAQVDAVQVNGTSAPFEVYLRVSVNGEFGGLYSAVVPIKSSNADSTAFQIDLNLDSSCKTTSGSAGVVFTATQNGAAPAAQAIRVAFDEVGLRVDSVGSVGASGTLGNFNYDTGAPFGNNTTWLAGTWTRPASGDSLVVSFQPATTSLPKGTYKAVVNLQGWYTFPASPGASSCTQFESANAGDPLQSNTSANVTVVYQVK